MYLYYLSILYVIEISIRCKYMSRMVAIELLQIIKDTPRITPSEMGGKLRFTTQYVRNTLRVLGELNLVKTPVRGSYIITELGSHVLINQEDEK